MNRLVKFKRL